jgi:tight adherence protein B
MGEGVIVMRGFLLAVVAVPLVVGCVRAARKAEPASRSRALRPRAGRRLPDFVRGPLAQALGRAEAGATPEDAATTWAVCVLAGVVVAGALSSSFVLVVLIAAFVGPVVAYRAAVARRDQRRAAAMPAALEAIASELRGGASVAEAVACVARSGSPIAADLQRVVERSELGLSLADALTQWPRECPQPGVRAAAGALAVAAAMGGRAAAAIDGLATSLRHRLDAVAEARALSSQARLSAVVVGAAPLGYLAFAALVDPAAVDALLTTAAGRLCLVIGLGLEGLAAWWIRHIVSVAP